VADVGKLGVEIAREFSKDVGDSSGESKPILVVPFSAPAAATPEAKLADSTFAILYGRLAISHKESVGLSKESLSTLDTNMAVERGKTEHATYVVFGGVENPGPTAALRVAVVKVSDASVIWDTSCPIPRQLRPRWIPRCQPSSTTTDRHRRESSRPPGRRIIRISWLPVLSGCQ
jgi:hypothetical protein